MFLNSQTIKTFFEDFNALQQITSLPKEHFVFYVFAQRGFLLLRYFWDRSFIYISNDPNKISSCFRSRLKSYLLSADLLRSQSSFRIKSFHSVRTVYNSSLALMISFYSFLTLISKSSFSSADSFSIVSRTCSNSSSNSSICHCKISSSVWHEDSVVELAFPFFSREELIESSLPSPILTTICEHWQWSQKSHLRKPSTGKQSISLLTFRNARKSKLKTKIFFLFFSRENEVAYTKKSNDFSVGKVCGLQRSWKRILGRLGENKNESLLILEKGMDTFKDRTFECRTRK